MRIGTGLLCFALIAVSAAQSFASERAAFLIETPKAKEKVATYIGTVDWSLDDNGAEPPTVSAKVALPTAGLRVSFVFRKNTDPTLPAAQTIEVRTENNGNIVPQAKQISVLQPRREDEINGKPLAGVPVTISGTYFIIGLAEEVQKARSNEAALRRELWIDLPMQLVDKRIAKLTIEKGKRGQQVIDAAFTAWNDASAAPGARQAETIFGDADLPAMHAAFVANEARFIRDYRGRTFKAKMPLHSVKEDAASRGHFFVAYGAAGDLICQVDREPQVALVAAKSKGDVLSVRGTIQGQASGSVVLSDCTLTDGE